MNVLEKLRVSGALHALSQSLIVPTVILLLLFAAYAAYTIGSLIVEVVVERRHYKVALPKLIARIDAAPFEMLHDVVAAGGLLDTQKERLDELIDYACLPEDALVEVAKRELAAEAERYDRALWWTDAAAKVAPMLGLMGTLIPLGPGIVALSGGDLETLSSSLLMAFDTTVAGLVVAVVCFLVSKLRRGWYRSYLSSLEGAMNTILEKVSILRSQGYDFPCVADTLDIVADGVVGSTTGNTMAGNAAESGIYAEVEDGKA